MKSRFRISVVAMALTSLVIAGFQTWWLRSSYNSELQLLRKEAGVLLRESVFELQFNWVLPRNAEKGEKKILMIDDDDEYYRRTRIRKAEPVQATQVYVNITTGSDTACPIDMPPGQKVEVKLDSLVLQRNLLSWSLTEQQIKALYRKKLNDAGLRVPAFVFRTSWDDSLPGMKALLLTPSVPIGFDHKHTFRAGIGGYSGLLFYRLRTQLAVSVFIVLLTVLSFWLLYRNLRNQQRLTEQKNQFISNITHELKTPIATVSVAIEALQNFNAGDNPERRKEYLDISQKELLRLSLLVDKVLKLSMFENNKLELNKEPFDMQALVQEVTGSMRLQFEKNHAQVDLSVEGGPFVIEADRLHMASVLFNLLDNALKYSRTQPQIHIRLSGHGNELELQVRDNGIGIPPAYTQKVFEKFFRVPQGDLHNVKGYGLGLSYVSGIVHKHRGTITVNSGVGKGSTFTITLPRKNG